VRDASGGVDPWFLDQISGLVDLRAELRSRPRCWNEPLLRRAKRAGLSDAQLAALRPELAGEDGVRALRHRLGLHPVYKTVDTCAAEFAAARRTTTQPTTRRPRSPVGPAEGAHPRLGAEPDRAGHRVRLLVRARGHGPARPEFETVMVNCNPETVSTDYDTADRSTSSRSPFEDVLEVLHCRGPLGPGRPAAPAWSG
jgi:carbamoyl-phosphate synthase large subunit